VNHLSAVLLTTLLLPCLLKAASSGSSPNPRLVVVSSDAHYRPGARLSKEMTEGTDKILRKLSDKDYCTPMLDIRSPFPLLVSLMVFCTRVMYNRYPISKRSFVAAVLKLW
jgi:hypothetical protein